MTDHTRQGGIRIRGRKAQLWVHPRCQWQGESRESCSTSILSVRVRAHFPSERVYDVEVCSVHEPAYVAAAQRARVLA